MSALDPLITWHLQNDKDQIMKDYLSVVIIRI